MIDRGKPINSDGGTVSLLKGGHWSPQPMTGCINYTPTGGTRVQQHRFFHNVLCRVQTASTIQSLAMYRQPNGNARNDHLPHLLSPPSRPPFPPQTYRHKVLVPVHCRVRGRHHLLSPSRRTSLNERRYCAFPFSLFMTCGLRRAALVLVLPALAKMPFGADI